MYSRITIITVAAPVKVLRGPHGPRIILLGLNKDLLLMYNQSIQQQIIVGCTIVRFYQTYCYPCFAADNCMTLDVKNGLQMRMPVH